MRRTLIVFAALATALAAISAASAQTLKLVTLAPEGSPWHDLIVDINESWKAISGGRTLFRIYAGGVAGDENVMISKMRINQYQAAVLSGAGLSQIATEIQALQMPMMLSSYEELDYVRDHLAPKLEAVVEAKGFKILNWGDAGWVHFFAERAVIRPNDLKPLKVFTWEGDPTYAEIMKEMGFQPVPLAATDIYTALQSGLINAIPTTPIVALSFQWFGLAKHMNSVKWTPLVGAMVISSAAWQSVPGELKPKLLRAAQDAALRARNKIRPIEDEAIAAMQSYGLIVDPVPPEALTEWQAIGRATYPKLIGKVVPAATVAEVERLRDEYRATRKTP